jgi:hypothetical protein
MRRHVTYANVMATLGVFIALGGTSYAVSKLPRNSVGTAQVRDGSLQRRDLAVSARGSRGPRGSQGPGGSPGERGPSSVRIATPGDGVALAGAAGVQTEVRRMDGVPAGAWLLSFLGSPRLTADTGLHTICDLKVNGDVKASGATVVGNSANASQEAELIVETALTQASPFNITVDCSQNSLSSPTVVLNRPQIVAVQVGGVVTTP